MRPRRRSWSLLARSVCAALALASCAQGQVDGPDPADAAPDALDAEDAAAPDDVAAPGDAPLDAPSAPDASPPPDAPPPLDASPPPDAPLPPDAPPVADAAPPIDLPAPPDRLVVADVAPPRDVAPPDAASCPTGWGRCGGACVDLARDPAHCGACGLVCPAGPRAVAACGAGRCGVVCDAGYRDCDGEAATGCEAEVATDVAHCGACGRACTPAHGTPTCAAGQCRVASCAAGYGDCNGAATDGCEVELATSGSHCGACGRACGAGQSCVAGACTTPVLESYEAGTWPWSPWLRGGGTTECVVTAACAHDGTRGMAGPSSGSRWYYRTDRAVGAAGQRLSAWVRSPTTAGRAYLGFGATAAGAWTFAFAPNTRQVGFYANNGWTFTMLGVATATLSVGVWYRMEVTFGAGGTVTGRVYDAAGGTVATLTVTIPSLPMGGVATYAFNTCVDTIRVE